MATCTMAKVRSLGLLPTSLATRALAVTVQSVTMSARAPEHRSVRRKKADKPHKQTRHPPDSGSTLLFRRFMTNPPFVFLHRKNKAIRGHAVTILYAPIAAPISPEVR